MNTKEQENTLDQAVYQKPIIEIIEMEYESHILGGSTDSIGNDGIYDGW